MDDEHIFQYALPDYFPDRQLHVLGEPGFVETQFSSTNGEVDGSGSIGGLKRAT